MSQDIMNYLNYTKKPWGKLFYEMAWYQIGELKNLNILDFGSGFGITANHLAAQNHVIAIEPNMDMVSMGTREHPFIQMFGSTNELEKIADESIDYIICHNVLEYITDRSTVLNELSRILKRNGKISIIKHNHYGRVMQKVIFENNIAEAIEILDGNESESMSFGTIHYYEKDELLDWLADFEIVKWNGLRTFWALQQDNSIKESAQWQESMLEIEKKVCGIKEFRDISFFHHIILEKRG